MSHSLQEHGYIWYGTLMNNSWFDDNLLPYNFYEESLHFLKTTNPFWWKFYTITFLWLCLPTLSRSGDICCHLYRIRGVLCCFLKTFTLQVTEVIEQKHIILDSNIFSSMICCWLICQYISSYLTVMNNMPIMIMTIQWFRNGHDSVKCCCCFTTRKTTQLFKPFRRE